MNWIKEKWIRMIIGLLFESKPGKVAFGWLNGHKTETGRWMSAISAILLILQTRFPEYAVIANANVIWLLIAGVATTELGLEHQTYKDK